MFIPLHDWGHLPQPTVMMLDQECQNSANAVLQAWTLQPPFCYKMESMGGLHHHIALFLIKEHEVARGNPDLCMDIWASVQFSLVAQLCPTLRPHEPRHARPPCPSPTPWVYPNSCPSSRWYHLAISSSVIPFSSWPQSFPASGSFPMSQLFASGGQSIEVSPSTSVLPKNTQDWSPLGWTSWISLQSKRLSRVFNTTVQKHQFFGTQLSSQSNSHIQTWPMEIHSLD